MELLRPAAKRGGIGIRDEGEAVWIAFDGPTIFAAATTYLWGDGEAELRLAGGARHKEWIGLLDKAVGDWARMNNAYALTMRGRKGWVRYARTFGWVALGKDEDGLTIFEKDLTSEQGR